MLGREVGMKGWRVNSWPRESLASLTADSCGLLPIRLTSRLAPLREEFQRALPLPPVKMIPLALGNLNCKLTYMSIMGVKAKAFWLSLAKISS